MIDGMLAAMGGGSVEAGSGSWTLLITYFVVAIGVSFFCSVWEAVLLSVTRPYIASLKEKNGKSGQRLEQMKNNINRPLTSILTLNTIAHTMGAIMVGVQVAGLTGGGIWDQVAGIVMTLAILVLSEIIPKNLGARHWRAWGPWVGASLSVLTKIMTPVIYVVELFGRGGHGGESFSREELKVMAEMGRREGKLEEKESRILKNLLQFGESSVRDVMTPRVVVFSVSQDLEVGDFADQHGEVPFSRVPLYGEDRDDVKGFVLKSDVLLAAARGERHRTVGEMRRDIMRLFAATRLSDAFEQLIANRSHAAVVVDEFGGMAGLVTMEDVVETLLGLEIVDEADKRVDMQEFARSMWKRRAERMGISLEALEENALGKEGS
ncbi:MAG: hemolysin family protein [Verrucomicrobiota bacterium]